MPLLLLSTSSPCIVNVASQSGLLRIFPADSLLKHQISNSSISLNELNELMNKFVTDVENGVHKQEGWPNTCYGMSKCGVIALTKIMAKLYPSIHINCCCPGYCDTDMTSHKGIYLSNYLSMYVFIYVCIYLSIYLYSYIFPYFFIYLIQYLHSYLITYLIIYLIIYLISIL